MIDTQNKGQKVTIIYLEDCVLLSKNQYSDWSEIQKEYYEKFKTCMDMTCNEIISFFEDDFKEEENWPFSRRDIIEFFDSDDVVIQSKE